MSSLERRPTGKVYWRSLDDLAGTPEVRALIQREFPAFADEMLAPSRRDFLKLMGASMALAGLTACRRWPAELVVPFAYLPDGYVPGMPVQYATSMEVAGAVLGLLVTSFDGRPVKIEGNAMHPASLGGTDPLAQASVLQLYDPDRAVRVANGSGSAKTERTWDEFASHARPIFARHRGGRGRGLRVVSESSSSPSLADMKSRFLAAFPEAVWHEYEPLTRDNEREGARAALGRPLRAQLGLENAAVIVSLDADLLMARPDGVRLAREFAKSRRPVDGRMSRMYAVESHYSLTGAVADHRLPVQARMVPVVAGRIASALVDRGLRLGDDLPGLLDAIAAFGANPFHDPLVDAIAEDLMAHRGRSLLVAGPKQPPAVHGLVHALNLALDNVGHTVVFTPDPDEARPTHLESIRSLTEAMTAGDVETLVVLGGNPVFDAPADLGFAAAMAKVPNTFRLGDYADETSDACGWHLPRAHYLEAWGDARSWDGTLSIVQPLIEPLYEGKSAIELVALLLDEEPTRGYDIVRRTWRGVLGDADFEPRWRRVLHDGFLADSAYAPATPKLVASGWTSELASLAEASPLEGDRLEVVFERDISVHDGRFANLGWLQEMPDPMTKATWDNPALLAPATARSLGVANGDIVKVDVDGRTAEAPVFIVPGQARGSVTLFPGYGRTRAGRVGDGVGVDLYPLRASTALWTAAARVTPTGRAHDVVTTQDRYIVDSLGKMEREVRSETLIREAELSRYLEEPDFAKHVVHVPEPVALWTEHEYNGHKWGMAIDLNACIGCNACAVACQAENNVPVVGKDEVRRGREMHWLRVDRYFQGSPDAPAVAFQPLTCHHCENAPCEQVCPVAATVHDSEGLNVMVYNRCIGTRYCSNNCPYKVRRFNWFNNHKSHSAVETMVFNPEVTLRSRGVMEKCTFCVQRIEAVKIRAKNEKRPIQDGEIVTACQQACPTEAIVFGDLNDPNAKVRKLHEDARTYGVLDEIYTKPRLKYMARLRNRSEEAGPMPGAESSAHEGTH